MRINGPYTKHLPDVIQDPWIVLASGNREIQVVLAFFLEHDAEAAISVCHTYKPKQNDRYSALSL